MCLKYAVPVYVIGVPAPFGRDKIEVKWVDPDPKYDQSPQWGEVVQGPESFMPERIKLRFGKQDDEPIDSGFGPYALSRLGYETGGTYHRVHSRLTQVDKKVTKKDTENLSSYLARFFDPKVMAPYRPDYVTIKEYQKLLADNKARESLVRAAHASWVTTMDSPRLTFPKKSEADLANIVTEAQKLAARLTPQINGLCGLLEQGVEDREQETKPRWKAGYDLAMGRVLAAKVRTEAYNLMLAQLKTGMQFKGADSDTWELVPADEITVGSALDRQAKQAREYLNRVVEQHEGTPWAYLAKKELEEPIGWKWTEKHTGVMAPKVAMGGGNAAPPRNDEKKMLKKPPPRRAVPKL